MSEYEFSKDATQFGIYERKPSKNNDEPSSKEPRYRLTDADFEGEPDIITVINVHEFAEGKPCPSDLRCAELDRALNYVDRLVEAGDIETLALFARDMAFMIRDYGFTCDTTLHKLEDLSRGTKKQSTNSRDLIEAARQINRKMVADKRSRKDRVAAIGKAFDRTESWMDKNGIFKK
jgi:hypothetical protein